jgi:hypothetical protein
MSQQGFRVLAWMVVALALFGAALSAQDAAVQPIAPQARVMVVNLTAEAVDLQLGDPAQFSVLALPAGSPTVWRTVAADLACNLFYRSASDPLWRYYQGADGQAQDLRFATGSLTVIRLGTTGAVDIITLAEQASDPASTVADDQPKVFFLNGTSLKLDRLSLRDASLVTVAESLGVPAQAMSYVVRLPAGSYAARWERGSEAGQTLGADENGRILPGLSDFQAGSFYLVLASQSSQVRIWQLGGR